MLNTVKDAFSEYKGNIDCEISNIDLFKKSKKLEIYLKSDKVIALEELDEFENYLKIKFEVIKVISHIEYSIEIENTISKDWGKIVMYLSSKYPIAKTIFKESAAESNKNKVMVVLKTKNAEFVQGSEIHEVLEVLLSNLYGKAYKVEYSEELDESIDIEQKKYLEDIKKEVYKKTIEEIDERDIKVISDNVIEEVKANQELETGLILGKNATIKSKVVEIADLAIENGRIAIEGRLVEVSHRELKNNKVLITFSLYDGTSTGVCKAFVEVGRSKEILERIHNAKKLKVSGNLQYDNYSKDLTIIVNKIVETSVGDEGTRKDTAPVKRVELHLHTQMSQMDGVSSVTSLIKEAVNFRNEVDCNYRPWSSAGFSRSKKDSK